MIFPVLANMTTIDFVNWLKNNKSEPTDAEWEEIKSRLASTFVKITPVYIIPDTGVPNRTNEIRDFFVYNNANTLNVPTTC